MKVADIAKAFVEGRAATCGNARTDGEVYYLHGHPIVTKLEKGGMSFDWCGWHTPTTANHMNKIMQALGDRTFGLHRVSYAQSRDAKIERFAV